jgi:tRNA modification GTPase
VTTREPTWVIVLTPTGRGAVATLLVAGPDAESLVAPMLHRPGGAPFDVVACGTIMFGRWRSAEHGEEVVVCRTRPHHVEIHSHGGRVAASAIADALVERGCQPLSWQDWIRVSEPDAATARIALARAPTARVAAILWDQHAGALRAALSDIDSRLARGDSTGALSQLDALLAREELGRHLTEPWRVVLAGPPNVGKSSLINALVGYERALVHDAPGTTRDVVGASTALDGWPVELLDTAGQRASDDPLETAGIELARQALAAADLAVLVSDASSPAATGEDTELSLAWPHALRVANKCDLIAGRPGHDSTRLFVSAKTGAGLEALRRAISARLVPNPPAAGDAVPLDADQLAALRLRRSSIAAAPTDSKAR